MSFDGRNDNIAMNTRTQSVRFNLNIFIKYHTVNYITNDDDVSFFKIMMTWHIIDQWQALLIEWKNGQNFKVPRGTYRPYQNNLAHNSYRMTYVSDLKLNYLMMNRNGFGAKMH